MTTETIQKKDKLVSSLKTSSKREFDSKVRLEDNFQFMASDLAGSYSGNPELWSLWYNQLLEGIFHGTEKLLLTPVSIEDANMSEAVNEFISGFERLADMASDQTDDDTTPLIKSRKKLSRFKESDTDSVTILVEIRGGDCEIQCVNGFISEQNINFTVSEESADSVEESALREHSKEVMDFFNSHSPYRRRPQKKYKRTLSISMKKQKDKSLVTIGVAESRTRGYSVIEKFMSLLGQEFEAESYEDFN